jgi:four helix bundle protein
MRLSGRNEQDLLKRTKAFAIRIIKMYAALPKSGEAQVIGKQVLRSGTSVGAHIAEAEHAKSRPDFQSKIEGALQELEETRYWMELLIEAQVVGAGKLQALLSESSELIAILVTIAHRSQKAQRALNNK